MPQPQTLTDLLPPAQPIDPQTVEQLAALARIRLTAEEHAAITEHLHRTLSHIEKLRQMNTEGTEPMAHTIDIAAPLRTDEVTNHPNTEELLQSAPGRSGNFFVVPRVNA